MKKIPTKQHCLRVKRLLQLDPDVSAIIYHRGGTQCLRDDTDVELDFRQESNFFYLTGTVLVVVLEFTRRLLTRYTINDV